MITRRGMVAGLALVAVPGFAEEMARSPRPVRRPDRAGPSVEDLVAAAKLDAPVSFLVADAGTGQVIEALDADRPLPPASVLKTVTALFALDRLGASHRFVTRVLALGPVVGGVVQGDLLLAGGGDPTLQTDQLGDLVARLGIKGVTGRLLYDDGALPALPFVDADQPVHVGYNPAVSGLNLNFNRVYFEWKRSGGWVTAVDARGERYVPPVGMVEVAVVDRDSPLFTYEQAPGRESWTVASGALGKGGSRWLPVRQPGLHAASVFRELAAAQGIALAAPVAGRGEGVELGRVESEPLPEVLRDMLKFSTNLTAEVCGLAASGAGSLAESAGLMGAWVRRRFGGTGRFADHSGLGGASRITASDMVAVLLRAEGLRGLLRDVGMKDDKGKVIEGHPVQVLAKSGTLNFVSGLAGHIVPPLGRELVFAVFMGDPARRDAVPVDLREGPEGSEAWTKRARRLQGQLVARWAG